MSILQRPEDADMTFDQRLFWLSEDIRSASMGQPPMAVGASSGFGGSFLPVSQRLQFHQRAVRDANTCFDMALEMARTESDNLCDVSEEDRTFRSEQGLPLEPVPNKTVKKSFQLVMRAKDGMGYFLQDNDQQAQALVIHHQVLNQAVSLNRKSVIWMDRSDLITLMCNLGRCYKRQRLYSRAQDWYDRCFALARPGSEDEDFLKNNLQYYLDEDKKEDERLRRPPAVLNHCWACSKNAKVTPNLQLFKCSRCTAVEDLPPEMIGMYCSKNCQKRDWKHHKAVYHPES